MTKRPAPAPKRRDTSTLPWRQPHVRDDLTVQLNTRMPERLALKIEWLALEAGMSKRDLVETALAEHITREFKRLGVPE